MSPIEKTSIKKASSLTESLSVRKQIELESKAAKDCVLKALLPGLPVNSSAGELNAVIKNSKNMAKVWGDGSGNFSLSVNRTSGACLLSGKISGTPKYALFPANTEAALSGSKIKTLISPVQTVAEGKPDLASVALVGKVSDGGVKFQPATSFLRVTAPSDTAGLTSIIICAEDAPLAGEAVFSTLDGAMSVSASTDSSSSMVTLKPAGGQFRSNADYYLSVKPFSSKLSVTYVYVDNSTHKAVTIGKKYSEIIRCLPGQASHLSAFAKDSAGVTVHTATQLWENGPYFADFNVGSIISNWGRLSSAVESYDGWKPRHSTLNIGGLYPWQNGNQNAHVSNWANEFDAYAGKTGDIAALLWGPSWREPSKEEFEKLCDKSLRLGVTLCDGVHKVYAPGCTLKGLKVSGRIGTPWAQNSIFLPFSGCYDFIDRSICFEHGEEASMLGFGEYWTSSDTGTTINEEGMNYPIFDEYADEPGWLKHVLFFDKLSMRVSKCLKIKGCAVRAVLVL